MSGLPDFSATGILKEELDPSGSVANSADKTYNNQSDVFFFWGFGLIGDDKFEFPASVVLNLNAGCPTIVTFTFDVETARVPFFQSYLIEMRCEFTDPLPVCNDLSRKHLRRSSLLFPSGRQIIIGCTKVVFRIRHAGPQHFQWFVNPREFDSYSSECHNLLTLNFALSS